jgi:hypothetical protein
MCDLLVGGHRWAVVHKYTVTQFKEVV